MRLLLFLGENFHIDLLLELGCVGGVIEGRIVSLRKIVMVEAESSETCTRSYSYARISDSW